ncbi:hypothetical protein LUZ60_008624 [Juncus effusus]|nr:hypothetical protein LUZ60_008624 [Juncus effusus]
MVEGLMEDLPLPALFEQARQIHSTASDSSVDQDTLRKGIELLRQCDEMVSKLGLFSSNETKDDVNTTNLKYLLVPFYLGELTEKVSQENRIPVIKSAQDQLKEFVSTCEALELVPEEELEASTRGDTFANLRAKKIARFKRQKAAEAKLQEIRERKERKRRSLRAAALSSPVEFHEDDSVDDDGEEEREAWLSTISLALCKAFDLLEMLKKEEEMLLAVKERQSQEGGEEEFAREVLDSRLQKRETWHRAAATSAPLSKPAEPIRCATFAQDVIEGRASIAQAGEHRHQHQHQHQPMIFGPTSVVNRGFSSEKERLAAQVFQPGYRLPTMSIEEAGMKEMEMMNKFTEMNTKMMQDARSAWHRDGTSLTPEEEEEMEEDKARAFDDWKDDNPRGAGNKKLTPCG